jgi:diketogulonate reductase-like aldo/keto reductase
MGTWHMGEPGARAAEAGALRLGLELGMRLIDTAEMYGEGQAERTVGEAIRGRREAVYLVSKFYPHHATAPKLRAACESSLDRLGVDRLDLYLLHWRGPTPLAETVATLEALVAEGRIGRWGVSNFDVADMEELFAVPGGDRCAANQVLYNLASRGIEYDLLPWCARRGVRIMAYSPLDEGRLVRHPVLRRLAGHLGASAAQLALAWLLHDARACVIPKAAREPHVRENHAALGLGLEAATLAELDRAFPPPRCKQPLGVI